MVLKRSVDLDYGEPRPNPAGASIFSLAGLPPPGKGWAERLLWHDHVGSRCSRGRVGMEEQERTIRVWENCQALPQIRGGGKPSKD